MTPPNDPKRKSRPAPPKKAPAPEPAKSSSSDEKTVADLDLQDLMRQLEAEGDLPTKK